MPGKDNVTKENWEAVFAKLEDSFNVRRPEHVSADYCCSCCGGEFMPTKTSCDYSCGS